jgi:hypothetical protein
MHIDIKKYHLFFQEGGIEFFQRRHVRLLEQNLWESAEMTGEGGGGGRGRGRGRGGV